jgi:penicillin-binding protein 1A
MRGFFGRKEPVFDAPRPRATDLRADPADRVSGPRNRKSRPRQDERNDEDFEEQRPSRRRKRGLLSRLFGGSDKNLGKNSDRNSGRGVKKSPRRRRSVFGTLVYTSLVLGIWATIGLAGLVAYHAAQLPPIDQLAVPKRPPNIAIVSEDGVLLANRGDTGGPAMHLRDLPPYLPKAFISIEDRRFYSHWGIDIPGIARAVFRNVTGRGGMQGGSTLTQQLAKNLFLTQERTMSRKIQEAILSIWLEQKYSKDQILELYLNRVYFGSGAYGVEAAAQKYFGHSARLVTLPEAAMLAGLMVAPTRLAPNRNPTGASERAAKVITAMAQEGHITESMAKIALARPAQAVRESGSSSINYAADFVTDILDDTIGAIDQDIVVTTTLSAALQSSAERALSDEIDKYGTRYGVSQGAVVAIDPNGQIRALVGGRNYADSQFNRAVAAKRQPGSAFKPFVYLTALESGLTPDSVRDDAPINIKGWKPANASHEYLGPVSLTQALSMSLNTVAVRLVQEVGPKAVVSTAQRLGIVSDLQPNASIALGTSEVTPLELVTAYASFANGGIRIQPHVITRVKTAAGKLLYQRKGTNFGRVVEPKYIAMMNAMMQETLLTGTARKAELRGWQAAGKTGTSQDYRDAWFVGYTSNLVAGVWLGNDDNSPTKKVSGGNLPVEIWSRFMREAHKNAVPQPLPSGTWRDLVPPPPPAGIPMASAAPNSIPVAAPAPNSGMNPLAAIGSLFSPPAPIAAPPQQQQQPPRGNGPMTINQAGEAAARNQSRPPSIRRDSGNSLIPPADIGSPRGNARNNDRTGSIPDQDRGLLSRLFGG